MVRNFYIIVEGDISMLIGVMQNQAWKSNVTKEESAINASMCMVP
jgi:hypothetical protein